MSQFQSSLTDCEIKLDWSRIVEIRFCKSFKQGPSPQKRLGFHYNLSTYRKETPATFFILLEDVCVTLYEIWEVLYLLTTQESTGARSTIKWWQNLVAATRSLLLVIWNLWMGSQSHKYECLCGANPIREEVCEFGVCTLSC